MPGLSPWQGSPDSCHQRPPTGDNIDAASRRPRGAERRREVANATREAHRCGARFSACAGAGRRRTLPPLIKQLSGKPGSDRSRVFCCPGPLARIERDGSNDGGPDSLPTCNVKLSLRRFYALFSSWSPKWPSLSTVAGSKPTPSSVTLNRMTPSTCTSARLKCDACACLTALCKASRATW